MKRKWLKPKEAFVPMEYEDKLYFTPEMVMHLAYRLYEEAQKFRKEYKDLHGMECELGIYNISQIFSNPPPFGRVNVSFSHKPKEEKK